MPDRTIQRFRRAAAGTLAVIALTASPATARPALEPQHNDSIDLAAQEQIAQPSADDGLEWGSIAIGAGAATIVCLLAGAGASTASRRHHRDPRAPTATAA
jgi:hypothetical protein